jgi:hypothetical protein
MALEKSAAELNKYRAIEKNSEHEASIRELEQDIKNLNLSSCEEGKKPDNG